MSRPDPVTDLVLNAMGCGVLLALDGRDALIEKLRALPPGGSLTDALADEAAGFIRTRVDLVEALGNQ